MVAPWIKMPAKTRKKSIVELAELEEKARLAIEQARTAVVCGTTPPPVAWSPVDKKAVLVEAATQRGLEITGLTKAQIIELLRSE